MSEKTYQVVALDTIHCSSTTHYSTKVVIRNMKTNKRDARDVDLSDFRLMHKNKPFTYKGYPKYVLADIAKRYKEAWDESKLSVCETDKYGQERRDNLRYHDKHILQRVINFNYRMFWE